MIKFVSIELTNKCAKQCFFCYNESNNLGQTTWQPSDLVSFIKDLEANGVEAVSFGGGEPLEYEGVFEVLKGTKGVLFRSMTSNGLLLGKSDYFDKLMMCEPDKVHLSIHFPENKSEVRRVKDQVIKIAEHGVLSGVNLLIRNDNVFEARMASDYLKSYGISNDRIVYLPMRMKNPVSSSKVRFVANDSHFQSISCLAKCGVSDRFCSISWDKQVGWCSYTKSKTKLNSLDFFSLKEVLTGLKLEYCG